MISIIGRVSNRRYMIYILMLLNLVLNLFIYYNTTNYRVSESHSVYLYLDQIQSGIKMPLLMNTYRSTLSYIAYGFIQLFGSIDAFFWFHALLGVLCVYLLFLILMRFSKSYSASIFGAFLATIYLDFHLLIPVLYYQVFEVLFALLIVYVTYLLMDSKNNGIAILYILSIVIIFYVSLLFRGTLRYLYYLMMIMGIIYLLKKDFPKAIIFIITFILMYSSVQILPLKHFSQKSSGPNNNFRFFGHTLYGGDGGEGAFIYEKNQKLYQERLNAYLKKNDIDSVNARVIYRFQEHEIKEFRKNYPYKWIMLQIRKIIYTYGIIPIKDNLIILTTGKLNLGLIGSAALLQFPFVIIMLLFVGMVTMGMKLNDFSNIQISFISLLLVYLISATCLYGHYQERYRVVVIMTAIIPLISWFYFRFSNAIKSSSLSKSRIVFSGLCLLGTIVFWIMQAYNSLVINAARFLNSM